MAGGHGLQATASRTRLMAWSSRKPGGSTADFPGVTMSRRGGRYDRRGDADADQAGLHFADVDRRPSVASSAASSTAARPGHHWRRRCRSGRMRRRIPAGYGCRTPRRSSPPSFPVQHAAVHGDQGGRWASLRRSSARMAASVSGGGLRRLSAGQASTSPASASSVSPTRLAHPRSP